MAVILYLTGSKMTIVLCNSGSGFNPSTREVYSSAVSKKCGNVNTTGASVDKEMKDMVIPIMINGNILEETESFFINMNILPF